MRADRLSVNSGDIILLPETSLEGILDSAARISPYAMVIDSIQTMYTQELLSAPGSVGQVRECAAKLMLFAKRSQIPVLLSDTSQRGRSRGLVSGISHTVAT
jgi:DNA repair protein RadA/Sms